jgi:hypothetical protein
MAGAVMEYGTASSRVTAAECSGPQCRCLVQQRGRQGQQAGYTDGAHRVACTAGVLAGGKLLPDTYKRKWCNAQQHMSLRTD